MEWHPYARGLIALTCATLTACSVGPAYERPDIAPPETWHETPTEKAAASVWPDADWWQGFGSTRLDDLIAQAQSNNDDLAGAIARVQEADAQVRIAGAPLFPSLDFGADATRQRAQVTGEGPQVYNVFNPQQTVALTVVSSVATTYFQALELRDRIEVAQQNLENGQKILRGLQLEQTVGTATGLDVAQQATAVALLDAAIPPLLQQFRQSVYALAVLIGKTPESVGVATGTLTELSSPPIVQGLPSELLARRRNSSSSPPTPTSRSRARHCFRASN